ncbi:hypothetical protein E2C01_075843 [Portunus trituberculatus]|uniref:Uncharacterized protein n=1 Tax=Portunus trituberculatus TaxID=210409 RepID=A0A5B7IGU3_PORTR|nr:hypothetical protein [Portunus trituberculatus]
MALRLPRGPPCCCCCLPNPILQVDQVLIVLVCSSGQVTAGPMRGTRGQQAGQVGQRYLGGAGGLLQAYRRNFEDVHGPGIHKASTSLISPPGAAPSHPPARGRLRSGSELHHHHTFLLLSDSPNPQRWRFFVTQRYEREKKTRK